MLLRFFNQSYMIYPPFKTEYHQYRPQAARMQQEVCCPACCKLAQTATEKQKPLEKIKRFLELVPAAGFELATP